MPDEQVKFLDQDSLRAIKDWANAKFAELQSLAAEYDATSTYSVGDLVVHEGVLYQCNADNTTGNWDSSKWDAITLDSLLALAILECKAYADGKTSPLALEIEKIKDGSQSVGHADSAASLDTSVGKLDRTPFNFMTSGGQTDIETGMQKTLKLVGANIVKNQQVINPTFTTATRWDILNGTLAVANNIGTYTVTTVTETAYGNRLSANSGSPLFISGHKYIAMFEAKSSVAGLVIWYSQTGSTRGCSATTVANEWVKGIGIFEANSNDAAWLRISNPSALSVNDTVDFKNAYIIDLTLMFGNNDVVNAILALDDQKSEVENLMLFLGGWLPTTYDEGSFLEPEVAQLISREFNQWNEVWELGALNANGDPIDSADKIRSKNYNRCLPNTKYYCYFGPYSVNQYGIRLCFYDENKEFISGEYVGNKQFTTPINAVYFKFSTNSQATPITVYNNDICINLSWGQERDGEYEAYKANSYDMPKVKLHGILKVDADGNIYADGDELYPSGEGNIKRYAIIDMGTIDWAREEVNGYYRFRTSQWAKLPGAIPSGFTEDSRCSKYVFDKAPIGHNDKNYVFAVYDGIPFVRDDAYTDAVSFKAAMSGVYLIYLLNDSAQEPIEAPGFPENIYADDWGTLQFLDENGDEIIGLQGCEIFYKANIAGFAESVYINAEGDPENVLYKSDKTELSAIDAQLKEALGDTLRQLLATSQSLDFDDTDFLDISEATWYHVGNGCFLIANSETTYSSNSATRISTKYKNNGSLDYQSEENRLAAEDKHMYGWAYNIWIKDTRYSDVTAFKAANKGVLIAYKKAE